MVALITGASSGIGREIAKILGERGYELILSARREDRLSELANELSVKCRILPVDLSDKGDCIRLYEELKNENIDILVNNAGFGVFGDFADTDLDRELKLVSVNVEAVHILTKLFLKDFTKKNKGYILNVASIAGFMSGPQMAAYYASKNYVLNLTAAVYEELRRKRSGVSISVLCPGPVRTEFSEVAGVDFGIMSMSARQVAQIAVDKMFKRKLFIIPGFLNKAGVFAVRFAPKKLALKVVYSLQEKKK